MKFILVNAYDFETKENEEIIMNLESIMCIHKSKTEDGFLLNYTRHTGMRIQSIFKDKESRDDEFNRIRGLLMPFGLLEPLPCPSSMINKLVKEAKDWEGE